MRGHVSVAGKATYSSLMARLAALQEGIGPRPMADGPEADDLAVAYRKRVIRTYFGCGVVTSVVIGCAALLPMLYAHPTAGGHASLEAIAADTALTAFLPDTKGRTAAAATQVFDLPIRYDERANAPFLLHVADTATGDAISIVLRNMPEAAWLSGGEREDEHTWRLRPADLANLRLLLRDGAPDAFDIHVEVASGVGSQTVRSVARVRLLDKPSQGQQQAEAITGTPDKTPTAANARGADTKTATQRPRTGTGGQRSADTTVHKEPAKSAALPTGKSSVVATEETDTALQRSAGTERIVRPDGMSALGAVARDPDQEGRQLWWKMPLPAWAPFNDGAGRN